MRRALHWFGGLALLGLAAWLGELGTGHVLRAAAYEAEVAGMHRVGGEDEMQRVRLGGWLYLGGGLVCLTGGGLALRSLKSSSPRTRFPA